MNKANVLLLIATIFVCFLPVFLQKIIAKYKKYIEIKRKHQEPKRIYRSSLIIKRAPLYDSEGYNRQGYNVVGRDRQGKYNRYYNVKCYRTNLYSEEGFLDVRKNPVFLTDHAIERMRERMGIGDIYTMEELAFEAYQFGKSKLQLMKSERAVIETKESKYENSIILIYRGYCYVFTDNNGLKTVYKNTIVKA